MKYTIRDVANRLTGVLNLVSNTDENKDIINDDAPTKLVEAYIKFVKAEHLVKYLKVNQQVVDNVYKYIEILHGETVSPEKKKEDEVKRERLIEKNLRLRGQLNLSDDCVDRNKYMVSATVWRDELAAIDFEEMRLTGGTSHGSKGYPLIEWDEWFEKGHLDANISEQEVEEKEAELVALLRKSTDSKEAAWVEINLKKSEIGRKAQIAEKTIAKYKKHWIEGNHGAENDEDRKPTKERIEALKKEAFKVHIMAQQIQALEDDNKTMKGKVLEASGAEPFGQSLPQWGDK
jgi:hypothetical protein